MERWGRLCPHPGELRVNGRKLWITRRRRFRIRHTRGVRWDHLFDDLASQFDAGLDEERRRAELEEERLRVARLTVRDRLVALAAALRPGERIGLQLHDGERVDIVPVEFGADWIGADLAGAAHRYGACIVPLAGVGALLLDREQTAASLAVRSERPSSLSARLGLAIALRDLARRRVACELSTRLGVVHGTIDRVGRDHVDVAVHSSDAVRRESQVALTRIIPLDDLVLVRIGTD